MIHSLIQEPATLLQKSFELPAVSERVSEENLVDLLSPIILQMLNRDFERLLQVCYRIDLGENKLRKILHESPPEQLAIDLAKAIVERQKQKIETRKKYSTGWE